MKIPFSSPRRLLPALILLAGVQFASAWSANIVWPGDLQNYANGYKEDSSSSTFTGPATLAFEWRITQNPAPEISLYKSNLVVKVDGVIATGIAPNRRWGDTTMQTGSVTIPAGEHTVTWTAGGNPEGGFPSFSITADVENVHLVTPETEVAEGLDTKLTITGLTSWNRSSDAGFRGGDRISLGAASGGFSTQITGPAVIAFRASMEGWYESDGFPRGHLKFTGPGVTNFDLAATAGNELHPDFHTRSFLIPAGTHTVSWSGQGAGPSQTLPGLTWHMDALDVFSPGDFASALNNTFTWTIDGSAGYTPRPDLAVSRDGAAVRFPGRASLRGQAIANGSLSTQVTGPALIGWWHRSEFDGAIFKAAMDGAPVSGLKPSKPDWQRQVVRVPAGDHTILLQRDPALSGFPGESWIDQFGPLPPFDAWLAGFLTEAELQDAASFAKDSDIDKDGLTAFMEYALQTSPVVPSLDRQPVLQRDPADANVLHFTWRESAAAAGVTFTAQKSADLSSWTGISAVQTGTDGNDRLMRATLSIIPGNQWVRLHIQ